MSDNSQPNNKFDAAVQDILDRFGQQLSRRGVIARLGRIFLGIFGITLLPSLPLDRRFVADAQADCLLWERCGIYGYACRCGGGVYQCPPSTQRGNFAWTRCCYDPILCREVSISYYDCCGPTSLTAECRGSFCANNTTQPAWCGGTSYELGYICTIVQIGANC
jgi:hypothetical protein